MVLLESRKGLDFETADGLAAFNPIWLGLTTSFTTLDQGALLCDCFSSVGESQTAFNYATEVTFKRIE